MKTPFQIFLDRIDKLNLSLNDWDVVAKAGAELAGDSRKEIYAEWQEYTKKVYRGK